LHTMQLRAAALRGKLSIASVPGGGTMVELIFKHN
jgi:nitrate/nitrite-specific signal transduction histidine kinase